MFTVMHQVRADLDDEGTMITQAQVGELLLEWTNPDNQMYVCPVRDVTGLSADRLSSSDIPGVKHDEMVHMDLAVEIAQALYDDEMEGAPLRLWCLSLSARS